MKYTHLIVATLALVLGLASSSFAGDNVLKNASFAERNENGTPVGWIVPKPEIAEIALVEAEDADAGLRAKINSITSSQGQVSQKVAVKQNRKVRVSTDVQSSITGAAFVQVKLFAKRKELKRIGVSGGSGPKWRNVFLELDTGDADQLEIVCRWKREKKYQGCVVGFKNAVVEDCGEMVYVPLAAESIACVSTLHSIGVEVNCVGDFAIPLKAAIEYRVVGLNEWKRAPSLVARPDEMQMRTSILDLVPETEYDVRLVSADRKVLLSQRISTWKIEPTIGKVIELPEQKDLSDPILIDVQGTPDAWVKYVPAKGSSGLISAKKGGPLHSVLFDGAQYVLFEGFTVRGGEDDAIRVIRSSDIFIRNCDIAEWGQTGTLNETGRAVDEKGKLINIQSGISVHVKSERVRLERNFIHSPNLSANSWQYGHPTGPSAVSMSNPLGNIVIKDNEFIGDETHWWNDAVEGEYNSYITGGPNRDTDVSGNVMAFANDDGIELDGGQRNVRCFNNLFRWTYCGVSCAPNLKGPSYVYRNVVVLGEERSRANFGMKMGGAKFKNQGISHVFNNTIIAHGMTHSAGHFGKGGSPISSWANVYHLGVINYRYSGGASFVGDLIPPNGLPLHLLQESKSTKASQPVYGVPEFVNEAAGDYRLARSPVKHHLGAFGADSDGTFPVRKDAITANPVLLQLGTELKGEATVSFPAGVGQNWKAHVNSDWIVCDPISGTLNGEQSTVKVNIRVQHAPVGKRRGAITFRTDTGAMKTVFLTADVLPEKPWSQVFEAEALTGTMSKREAASASGGAYVHVTEEQSYMKSSITLNVDIPEDGRYQIWMRTHAQGPETLMNDSLFISLDGEEPRRLDFDGRGPAHWFWNVAGVWEGKQKYWVTLTKGKHEFKIFGRESLTSIDQIFIGNHAVIDTTPAASNQL